MTIIQLLLHPDYHKIYLPCKKLLPKSYLDVLKWIKLNVKSKWWFCHVHYPEEIFTTKLSYIDNTDVDILDELLSKSKEYRNNPENNDIVIIFDNPTDAILCKLTWN